MSNNFSFSVTKLSLSFDKNKKNLNFFQKILDFRWMFVNKSYREVALLQVIDRELHPVAEPSLIARGNMLRAPFFRFPLF